MPNSQRADLGTPRGWSLRVRAADDGSAVITATGEFDVAAVPDVRQAITTAVDAVAKPTKVVVDLSEVTFLDAAFLGVLVTERQALQRVRGDLTVIGVTPWSLRIIEICGLRETLGVVIAPS